MLGRDRLVLKRHCEWRRPEAIQPERVSGLPRYARNDMRLLISGRAPLHGC